MPEYTTETVRSDLIQTSSWRFQAGDIGPKFDRWLSDVLADAWDEGHRTYQKREPDECYCSAWSEGECACGLYGTGKIITPNPHRRSE